MRDIVIIEFRPSPGPSGLGTSPGAKTFIRGAVLHNQILVEPFSPKIENPSPRVSTSGAQGETLRPGTGESGSRSDPPR
jgi:hypothetical protein